MEINVLSRAIGRVDLGAGNCEKTKKKEMQGLVPALAGTIQVLKDDALELFKVVVVVDN